MARNLVAGHMDYYSIHPAAKEPDIRDSELPLVTLQSQVRGFQWSHTISSLYLHLHLHLSALLIENIIAYVSLLVHLEADKVSLFLL